MIIFLYGPDDYRRETKKREILAEFRKRHNNFGPMTFDLSEEGNFEKFREFLGSQSLFQSAKLVVLESSFEATSDMFKELKKTLKEFLENKDTTILVSERDKPVKTLEFLRGKPVLFQEFEFLEGREWESFILKEAERLGVKITAAALKFLEEAYQNNTWALVTELEKVQHLSNPSRGSGPRAEIDARDFEDLGVEQAPNFWSLILGFKARNLPDRLRALEKIFSTNEPPAKVFNVLAYQLPDKLQDLARYDLMVKSGKLEYEEVLLDLAIN